MAEREEAQEEATGKGEGVQEAKGLQVLSHNHRACRGLVPFTSIACFPSIVHRVVDGAHFVSRNVPHVTGAFVIYCRRRRKII